jgi:hypothetical protein
VFSRVEGCNGLRVVKKRRSGDIDQVDVVASQHFIDVLDVGNAETLCRGVSRDPVRSRHRDQLHAGHLGELLKGVESKSTTADDRESNLTLIHQALHYHPAAL